MDRRDSGADRGNTVSACRIDRVGRMDAQIDGIEVLASGSGGEARRIEEEDIRHLQCIMQYLTFVICVPRCTHLVHRKKFC